MDRAAIQTVFTMSLQDSTCLNHTWQVFCFKDCARLFCDCLFCELITYCTTFVVRSRGDHRLHGIYRNVDRAAIGAYSSRALHLKRSQVTSCAAHHSSTCACLSTCVSQPERVYASIYLHPHACTHKHIYTNVHHIHTILTTHSHVVHVGNNERITGTLSCKPRVPSWVLSST